MVGYDRVREHQLQRTNRPIFQHHEPNTRRPEHLLSGDTPANVIYLLNNPRILERGIQPRQSALMRQMQQTYGNRAIQRFLQRDVNGAIYTPGKDQHRAGSRKLFGSEALIQKKSVLQGSGVPIEADNATATDKPTRVAELAKRVGSATGLRVALAADPSLAAEIQGYFAAGNQDATLNDLMGQAFSPARERKPQRPLSEPDGAKEKNPADPTIALPAQRQGDKTLTKGQMKWTLKAVTQSEARCDADFKPDKDKVEAKTVSFGQTVLNQVGAKRAYAGGTATNPDRLKAKFEPYEEATTKKRIDHLVDSENDPFYGAEWDQAGKKWKQERADWKIGKSTKGVNSQSATLFDSPTVPWAREGLGDTSTEFETVAMVLETREPLGALKWGFKIKDAVNAPIELTGATDADCTDTPSVEWGAAMDKFYDAKFNTILDDFDVAKADLKADHKTKLDTLAATMKGNAALKAQLGGACDLTGDEKFNQALSLKRAETARDYLVSKGIAAGRLEVQSYSFDWARVEAQKGKSEGKNRRVQIWLR